MKRAEPRGRLQSLLIAVTLLILATLVSCGTPQAEERAEQTVRSVLEGLSRNEPVILWRYLPGRYQNDITQLVSRFAEVADPPLYHRAFQVFGNATLLMKNKRDFILEHPLASQNVDPEEARRNWDSVVALMETLANSELARLEDLTTLDIEAFLESTGKSLLKQMHALRPMAREAPPDFASYRVETVAEQNGISTIRLIAPDNSSEVLDMVRVEERWVPKQWADNWALQISTLRAALDQYAAQDREQTRMAGLFVLTLVDGAITELQTAQSQEAFNLTLMALMGSFLSDDPPQSLSPPPG